MRSKDRLAELRQLAGVAASALPEPAPADGALHKELEEIFLEVERMRGWLQELEQLTEVMRRLHCDPTFHNARDLQDRLDATATTWGGVALKASGALRQLEARVASKGGGALASRVAAMHFCGARRRFADALDAHHRLLDSVRDTQLRLLRHQVRLADLAVSDEECEALLDTRNVALFVDNVRAETAEAKRVLRDVEARRDELAKVEASLKEVRDLFAQLAHLVATQQEQVDSVEYFALQASEHVDSGGQQLLKGTVSRTKSRKKKLSVAVCLVVGLGVVLLVLVLT